MAMLLRGSILTVVLVALDSLAFCGIWFGLYLVRDWLNDAGILRVPINAISNYLLAPLVYLPFWVLLEWYEGLYSHRGRLTGLNQLTAILRTLFMGTLWSLALAYLFKNWDMGRFILLLTPPVFVVWLYFSRTYVRRWKEAMLSRGMGTTRVLIIGVGRTARRVMHRLTSIEHSHYRVVGFVDNHNRRRINGRLEGVPVLGSVKNLARIIQKVPVDEVFLAVPTMPQTDVLNMIIDHEHLGVRFKVVSNLFEVITGNMQIDEIDEVPVVEIRNAQLPPFQSFVKRVMDIIVSLILLIILAVPMAMIAVIVMLDSPGPAFFVQERVGYRGRRFRMYKFRTMYTDTEKYAVAPMEASDPRITRSGQWLRKFSFDEFPQLWNVVRGEMSMVGPRPEMPFLVAGYEAWERRRLDVKPGVTGLWQIVGRKNLPLSLNMEYDFYYIKNQSLLFDIIILIKTIPAVLFGKGAF